MVGTALLPAPISIGASSEHAERSPNHVQTDKLSAAVVVRDQPSSESRRDDQGKVEAFHNFLGQTPVALTTSVYLPDKVSHEAHRADQTTPNVNCCAKDTQALSQPEQTEFTFECSALDQIFQGLRGPAGDHHSLVGKSRAIDDPPRASRSGPSRSSPTQTKSKSTKLKRTRKMTISKDERALADRSYFVAEAKGWNLNMAADFNPGIDHLDVEERLLFCRKIENNLVSYARGRCAVRGKPLSWWPGVFMWARESTRGTNLDEHLHMLFHVPDDEERRHLRRLMDEKRKDPNAKRWCDNAHFRFVDNLEHWNGRKFVSALSYLLKMANPQDYNNDSTLFYKRSGFITGPRIRISGNLINPKVIAETEVDVQALMRLRDERRIIMRRNGVKPARDPRTLVHPLWPMK